MRGFFSVNSKSIIGVFLPAHYFIPANVSTPFMLFMVKGTSSLLDIIERSVTFDLQDLVSSQMRLILHFGLVFLVSVEQLE